MRRIIFIWWHRSLIFFWLNICFPSFFLIFPRGFVWLFSSYSHLFCFERFLWFIQIARWLDIFGWGDWWIFGIYFLRGRHVMNRGILYFHLVYLLFLRKARFRYQIASDGLGLFRRVATPFSCFRHDEINRTLIPVASRQLIIF